MSQIILVIDGQTVYSNVTNPGGGGGPVVIPPVIIPPVSSGTILVPWDANSQIQAPTDSSVPLRINTAEWVQFLQKLHNFGGGIFRVPLSGITKPFNPTNGGRFSLTEAGGSAGILWSGSVSVNGLPTGITINNDSNPNVTFTVGGPPGFAMFNVPYGGYFEIELHNSNGQSGAVVLQLASPARY